MQRARSFFAGLVVAVCGAAISAQTPVTSVTASVSTPASVACSAPLSSAVTLTGFNNETPGFADIVLVMDESGSIDSNEWLKWDQFVDATIDLLDLGNTNNRVAIVKYSSNAQLTRAFTNDAAALKSIPRTFPGGSTATHQGIATARALMSAQARAGANKFIIVLTDGFCTCTLADVNTQARQAEAAGATVIAVGVDGANTNELDLIGTDIAGVDTSIFVTDFDELTNAVQTLIEAIVTPGATDISVVVDAGARFPVTGATASAGTAVVNGSQVTWTLPSLGAGSHTLTIEQQHDGTGNGAQQVFTATYSDAEAHAVSIEPATTTVTGCNVAPVAHAGPDRTVPLSGASASVTLDASGTTDDGLIQPLSYSWSSNTGVVATGVAPIVSLPLGTHTFTLSVNDGQFTDTDTVVIAVVDAGAPLIDSVTPSTTTLWPISHQMVPVSFTVAASDNSGVAPTCTVTSVTSNEAANGKGDGNTASDTSITGPLSVELRAERAGTGSGRTYTATITCTDAAGNSSTKTASVIAPKSQKK